MRFAIAPKLAVSVVAIFSAVGLVAGLWPAWSLVDAQTLNHSAISNTTQRLVQNSLSVGAVEAQQRTPNLAQRADLIWVEDATGCDGATIELAVMIENPDTAVDAFTLDLEYPVDMLDYVSCTEGALNPTWIMFDCNETTSGVIRALAFAFGESIPAGSSGSLVVFTFTVNCPDCINNQTGTLSLTTLMDDIETFTATPGIFTYYCEVATPTATLSPTTTSAATLTPTRTATRTNTPPATNTTSPTYTATRTPTLTGTAPATLTPTKTATLTATNSPTLTATRTPTETTPATAPPTLTATATGTASPTLTPTGTEPATLTPTRTPTLLPTWTGTKTATATSTPTLTPTVVPTDSPIATFTVEPSPTPPPTLPPTQTATTPPTATFTATIIPTDLPTVSPTPGIELLELNLLITKTQPDCFLEGDDFQVVIEIMNPGRSHQVDLYCILDVFGAYYFYPTWTQDLQAETITAPPSTSHYPILAFTWPEVEGQLSNLLFWAACLETGTIELGSNVANVVFCYGY